MPQIERFDLPEDPNYGEQFAMGHKRPNNDQVVKIGNYYSRSMAELRTFDVMRMTIQTLCTEWQVYDPDTGSRLPMDAKGIGAAPQDIVLGLYDQLYDVISPLIPNFERRTPPTG